MATLHKCICAMPINICKNVGLKLKAFSKLKPNFQSDIRPIKVKAYIVILPVKNVFFSFTEVIPTHDVSKETCLEIINSIKFSD